MTAETAPEERMARRAELLAARYGVGSPFSLRLWCLGGPAPVSVPSGQTPAAHGISRRAGHGHAVSSILLFAADVINLSTVSLSPCGSFEKHGLGWWESTGLIGGNPII